MKSFGYHNPVQVVFGRGSLDALQQHAPALGEKVLLVTGSGSIKKSGIYNKIVNMLEKAKLQIFTLEGVKSNPELAEVYKGINIAKEDDVDFVLGAGGGSVIDTSKAIAVGSKYDGDVWDFWTHKCEISAALPIITVVTIAGSGSEVTPVSVLTDPRSKYKLYIRSPYFYPRISILDPELTITVPKEHTAYSSVDIIAHVIEGYFTSEDNNTPIQDGFSETIVKTVMKETELVMKNAIDMGARSNLMWASTLALNGILTAGIGKYQVQNHALGHALSGIYDVPHGAALSIVIPAWMQVNLELLENRLNKFGRNVFGFESLLDSGADETVRRLKSFFSEIGAPVSLSEIDINEIKALVNNVLETSHFRGIKFGKEGVEKIFEAAL